MRHPLGARRKIDGRLAAAVALVAACTTGALRSPFELDASSRSLADASVLDVAASDMDDGSDDAFPAPADGSFGHCCFDDQLFSCFCPSGAQCHFGSACADGGCVEGDGAACGAVADGGAE